MGRALRIHHAQRVIRNRIKLLKILNISYSNPGLYRKIKPLDCGQSKCDLCHSEKNFGINKLGQKRRNKKRDLDLELSTY